MIKNLIVGFLVSSVNFCLGFITCSLFIKNEQGGEKKNE